MGETVTSRQEELRRRLVELGFDEVRFARLAEWGETQSERALETWVAQGMHADMAWMERTAAKRSQPELVLPGAQSVIMLGINYWRETLDDPSGGAPARPKWARYALYEDYHDTVKTALIAGGRALEELYGVASSDYRYYVDTGPVLERAWAERAGIGFVGKNTMLISRQHGNWLFLAAILTKLDFVPDAPIRKTQIGATGTSGVGLLCGKCTRCIDACPTGALPQPGVLDARRCISYQTIENKGIIPRELRLGIGDRIYGCDICLEVCPWNRFARQGRQMLLAARPQIAGLTLRETLELTPARFAEIFRGTAVKRLKLAGLLRNACVVAGNSGDVSLVDVLVPLARHELPLVRAHAVWAVRRLVSDRAETLLREARAFEKEAAVLAEYEGDVRQA